MADGVSRRVDHRTMSRAGNASTARKSCTEVWGASTPFGWRLTSLSMTEWKEFHCQLSTRDRQPSFSYLIRRYCLRKKAGEPKLSPLLGRDSKISSQVSGFFGAAYKPSSLKVRPGPKVQKLEPRAQSLFYSVIFATCTANPVLGSNDVSSNALKPSPLTSVCR